LYSAGKSRKGAEDRESYTKTREQKELEECTFHPDISKSAKSKPKLMSDSTLKDCSVNYLNETKNGFKSVDRFNSLYKDWSRRKSKREEANISFMNELTPFKPKVNRLSEMIINGVSFEERQR